MGKKEIAMDFLSRCAKGDSREAFRMYVGNGFRHHNVWFKGDADTLMVAMEDAAKASPGKSFEMKRALEDGDLVAVHSHYKQNQESTGGAVIHIFRFNENKIVELWDFGQEIPEDMVNENGMF